MKKEYQILLLVGVGYFIYIFLFLAKFNFNLSATIELAENRLYLFNAPPPPNLVVQIDSDGYDGYFFYLLTTDLAHERILVPPYRYQRIFYSFLAYLFSFGQIDFFPLSLLLINYLSVILGTYIVVLLLNRYQANLNLALLWAFNVGFCICILRDLASPLLFLFILLAIYCYEIDKLFLSTLFFSFALLTKEAGIMILLPMLFYLFCRKEYKKGFILTIPLFCLLVWQIIIWAKLGYAPMIGIPGERSSIGQITIPFVGLIQYLSWIKVPANLQEGYTYFSIFPLLLFALIEGYLIIKKGLGKCSLYGTILLFQLFFIVSLKFYLYTELIDNLGRYGIGLFLFSLLYVAQRKEKYHPALICLMVGMSLGYAFYKIVLFKVSYFIT